MRIKRIGTCFDWKFPQQQFRTQVKQLVYRSNDIYKINCKKKENGDIK